jgi:hypothetical protein
VHPRSPLPPPHPPGVNGGGTLGAHWPPRRGVERAAADLSRYVRITPLVRVFAHKTHTRALQLTPRTHAPPQRRAHELRAAERVAPVALSRVLLGSGACVLSAHSSEDDCSDADAPPPAASAARRAARQLRVRSGGGYRTVLSTHGAGAGAWLAEVSLPRVGPTGAVRLGFAPDDAPLCGPVGAAASPPGGADAHAAGFGARGATGQALRAGAPPARRRGPAFGEGDTVRGRCSPQRDTHTSASHSLYLNPKSLSPKPFLF